MADAEQSDVMSLTVALLSAYFANNNVPSSELPALVEATRKALLGDAPAGAPDPNVALEAPPAEAPASIAEFRPAVTIDESLASPDTILSMIDGKPYKALKRHLATHGLTPAEYRARYGLPADYPMVAPGYSAARRAVALKLGLGGKRKAALPSVSVEPDAAPVSESPSPSSEPVVEAKPEVSVPGRKPRAKAAPAGEPIKKKSTRNAAGARALRTARDTASKAKSEPKAKFAPRRSRTRKGGAVTPEQVAPAPAEPVLASE